MRCVVLQELLSAALGGGGGGPGATNKHAAGGEKGGRRSTLSVTKSLVALLATCGLTPNTPDKPVSTTPNTEEKKGDGLTPDTQDKPAGRCSLVIPLRLMLLNTGCIYF